jgi:hypothetical protein
MRYWFSPFPQPATQLSLLAEANLQPWTAEKTATPDERCLLLYDSPDGVIRAAAERQEGALTITPRELREGYSTLLDESRRFGHLLLASWQLRRLGLQGLRQWLVEGNDGLAALRAQVFEPDPIPVLLAATTLCLTEAEPQLLNGYHDLELSATLLGRDPDLHYLQRLRQASQDGVALLHALDQTLRMPVESRELERRLASKESELLVTREELEAQARDIHHLKANLNTLNETRQQELSALRQHFASQQAELEQRLIAQASELQAARTEGEERLVRLHQVQEELEARFLANRDKQDQLRSQAEEIQNLREKSQTQAERHQAELQEWQQAQAGLRATHAQELTDLRQRLEPQLAALEQQLSTRESELLEARKGAEFTALQLHQVQEELEHQFLASRASHQLVEAQVEQLERAQRLLARLQRHGSPSLPSMATVAVEVLPATDAMPSRANSLQTEALLSTYAATLKRANDLLERARRP